MGVASHQAQIESKCKGKQVSQQGRALCPFFYSITLCMLSKTLCGGLICKSNSVV